MFRKTGYLLLATTMAFGVSVASSAHAQETIRMTAAMGHPEALLWVKHFHETFIPAVDAELAKTGEVKIEWTEGYGGTIVKVGSEVDAFQQGIMDIGHIMPVFNASTVGIMNLTYAMPFGPEGDELVAKAAEKALRDTGAFEKIEEELGIVYIGGATAIDDYNIASKEPLKSLADLDGMKIGGAGPNLAWLRTTGAVGVQGSYVSFYNDLKAGVYDGIIGWLTANVPNKIHEVAPNHNMVHMGAMYTGGLGIAKARWDTFSDDTKQAFLTAAVVFNRAFFDEQHARYEASSKALVEQGGTFVEFSAEDRAKWIAQMPNPATEWKAAAEARGEDAGGVLKAYKAELEKSGFTFVRDYLAE